MHLGEKFDETITNRMNGKDLGYDEFTGRFFEVRHSATAADAAAAAGGGGPRDGAASTIVSENLAASVVAVERRL